MPRKEGMERKDLLAANVKIFKVQVSRKHEQFIFKLYKLAVKIILKMGK